MIDAGGAKVLVTKEYTETKYAKKNQTTAPTSKTDVGFAGEIRITVDYIYTCVTANSWVRAAVSTW